MPHKTEEHRSKERKIEKCRAQAIVLLKPQSHLPDPRAWLEEQAKAYPALQLQWFLAYADDGVIWGELRAGRLITSDSVTNVSPELRAATLQQARLFSQQGELLLWRDGDNLWNARLLSEMGPEEEADWVEAFDEPQLLWGTHGKHVGAEFTLLLDGAQGLCHAMPLVLPLGAHDEATPPRLWVRHYLAQDDFARIEVSRLVSLGDIARDTVLGDTELGDTELGDTG